MSASNSRPIMLFGIQGKVALLVIAATAASALLVAKVLTNRAADVLREHELVDLGDEAVLRGWEIIDQIDGLRDDLVKLAISAEFKEALAAKLPADELKKIARAQCRRGWQNHLRIDVLTSEDLTAPATLIHEKGRIAQSDFWFPEADAMAGPGLHFSQIQRVRLTRLDVPGEPLDRWEPVIWAVAPLFRVDQNEPIKRYIRIMMTLHSPDSPRHLFTMIDADGRPIVRHDEAEEEDRGNDDVFIELSRSPELIEVIEEHQQRYTDPETPEEEPKVDRLLLTTSVKLKSPYYFQEGQPDGALAASLEAMNADEVERFLEDLQGRFGRIVRIGGLMSGVREIRLLGHSADEVGEVRRQIDEALAEKFPGSKMNWRNLVECDEMHSWAVRMLVGEGESRSIYLIQYAVFDDELASSIEYEMISVQSISLLVAGGFGLLGFLFAMRFIRPLKQMTVTAQKITESPRDSLAREIAGLAQGLDLKRRDEVGDIARASKRLFEEVIASQEELEQRVSDRTRELRRTNIELEKANEKLKSLSHEKDAFVAKVSHDLRQPLNAIFLQVEALSLSKLDDSQKKDVQRIRDHAARELNLVNDILEYQKIIMGAETLDRDTVAIASLLDDIAETNRASLEHKPVTLATEYPDDIGELVADDRRLRQILGNLVGNACKFTRAGSVTLGARAQEINQEAWIEFTVTDTGRGMSPSEQAQAFVPFVSNKKDNAGGSGLGLSICRELVAQMGGKIGFVSELDKGTHFSVFLPRVPTSEHYDPKDSLPHHLPASPGDDFDPEPGERGTTILVIDDDAKVRDLLTRLLEKDGHRVITAEDGNEGLALAEKFRPDAITLDVVMPGGKDGWEVLRSLKESPATQPIPVIMVSVMAEQEHAHTLEVEDYLVKPIDVERLSRSINRVTHRAPQRNLLLIDDEEDSLDSMSRILEAAGWHTLRARNGREGLDLLAKTRPAAIVLDLIMPEMDGFEFLHHLRSHPQLLSIPVIVMSGKDPSPEERAFLRERVDTVIRKGKLTSQELLAAVKARLRQVKQASA